MDVAWEQTDEDGGAAAPPDMADWFNPTLLVEGVAG